MIAIILITTSIGKTPTVLEVLGKITGVTDISACAGPYDIIAKAEAENQSALGLLVDKGIRSIEGVVEVTLCIRITLE